MMVLWRSWLTVSIVIFIVLSGFSGLGLFQNAALLSEMKQRRLAVVAETVGDAFKPILDLGLPISMMRNGDATVSRLHQTDPDISAISVFNPSGIVVYGAGSEKPPSIGDAAMQAWRLAEGDAWNFESNDALFNGWTIRRKNGDVAGGVLVTYPVSHLSPMRIEASRRTLSFALVIWLGSSLAALGILSILLKGQIRAIASLKAFAGGEPRDGNLHGDAANTSENDPLGGLTTDLHQAERQSAAVFRALAELDPAAVHGQRTATIEQPDTLVQHDPGASKARSLARLLMPWAIALIIFPTFILGAKLLADASDAVRPEIEARVALIGSIVGDHIQRAVSAGIPVEAVAANSGFFANLLTEFPEVGYLAIARDAIVMEAGTMPADAQAIARYPIGAEGDRLGDLLVGQSSGFLRRSYGDVFLDVGVLTLVAVLAAFEVLVLMLSRSLTGPIDRLSHIAGMQAAGDFSKWILVETRGTVNTITARLSARAVDISQAIAALVAKGMALDDPRIAPIVSQTGLGPQGPARLVFAYLTDVRLALFLFSVADELPLSFMPLYTRAAENNLRWLNDGVLLSLPLAGYLLAILLISPFARQLMLRFGYKRVLVMGVMPALLGQIGLVVSSTAIEIIAFRTLTGFGYAIVTLVCQDYVIDVSPARAQPQSLAQFSMVLFGGVFAGTALGGVLADRLGFPAVFAVSAGLILISGLLFLRMLPAWQSAAAKAADHGLRRPRLIGSLRNLRFMGLVLGIAIPWNIQNQAFICYLVSLVLDSNGASPADIGRMLMLNFLLLAISGPLATRYLGQKVSPSVMAFVGAAVAGAALVAAAMDLSVWTLLAAVVVGGTCQGIIRGPQVSVALEIASEDPDFGGPDTALAALRTLERGGSIVGLIAVAAIAGSADFAIAILAVGAWVLAGALFFLVTERFIPRPPVRDVGTMVG